MLEHRFEDYVRDFREKRVKLASGTPVLVRVGTDETGEAKLGFRTLTKHGEVHVGKSGHPALSELGSVNLIVKKVGAAFPDQISIGRTSNTDVYLPLPGISKYHAFFSLASGGIHTLTDAGSKNGTWVNDLRLIPKRPVRVGDGDLVSLGSSDFVFHSYAGFLRLLQKASGG